MSVDRWSDVIGRITAAEPESLDDLLFAPQKPEREGRDIFPSLEADSMPRAPAMREDSVAVGFRVTEPVADIVDRAIRLASFAIEQDVEVVILSHIDESGFERFGFRVERVAGDTPEARAGCEAQIRRFWNIDLVL